MNRVSGRIGGSLLLVALCAAPAFAQADFTGTWGARYQEDFPERIPGPDLGDYLGLPINASARQFADSWDPSRITLPEEQCRVHVSPYIYRGPLNLRIWEDRDPETQELVAIKHHISTYDQTRTIYMDGRPHPSAIAAHTWKGFSTGKWLGDMLVVDTTHIKQGWHRRNGLPMSDQATLTEYFVRSGDVLTRISITKDPVYLPRVAGQSSPAPAAPAPNAAAQNLDAVQMQVLHVQGNVYMIVGAGGNTTVQAGDSGVLIVDTQLPQLSVKLLAAIRTFSPKPIHYIINTHVHDDHVGGNENLAKAGPTRPDRAPIDAGLGGNTGAQTTIIAHENVLNRMVAAGPDARPARLWPTDTYFEGDKELFFNGEAVQIIHPPAAHTDGDSIVFFRRSDVIATGDIFTTTMYPFIDVARGGSVNGIIDGLNRIIDLAIPDHKVQEGGTMIVPGHGRLCDEQDVIEYRDMVTIVRDRIQYMIKKGMTLDQVKAARPTLDFDPRYGTATGFWTTAMFVDTIYAELSKRK